MANREEKRKDEEQLQKFRDALTQTLGDAIRKPMSARLGYQDENGEIFVQVPDTRSDQPNRYYFHEAGGTPFQGEAWLQPGAMSAWQIRYNMPVRIRRDPLTGEWEIIGIDSRFAQQWLDGVTEEDETIYFYEKLAPGLLTATTPNTMTAKVLPAAYRLGDDFKYLGPFTTVDWGVAPDDANVPTNVTRSRYALVQVDFANETLSYKYGDLFPKGYSFRQVVALDAGTGDYLPDPDPDHFMSGYVELSGGLTVIQRRNIVPLQQYLTLVSVADNAAFLDSIVTADGDVVVDPDTGNIVYISVA